MQAETITLNRIICIGHSHKFWSYQYYMSRQWYELFKSERKLWKAKRSEKLTQNPWDINTLNLKINRVIGDRQTEGGTWKQVK